jgi:cyanophycinase
MTALEGELLQAAVIRGKREVFVQLPTAAGQEDASRLEHWHELGRVQGQRLAVNTDSLRLYTREDAFNPEFVEAIQDAGLIYLSGGDPHHLAESLIDTPVWEAIVRAWSTGSSLMGCSAGAMALGSEIIAFRNSPVSSGLGLLPMIQTIPHYDRFLGWLPDRVSAAIMRVEEGTHLIGIDENTAMVRDSADSPWRVWGEGKVHLLKISQTHSFVAGEEITFR